LKDITAKNVKIPALCYETPCSLLPNFCYFLVRVRTPLPPIYRLGINAAGNSFLPFRHAPVALPGTHCTGGWEGHNAGLNGCAKSRPRPGFDSGAVQAVLSRYIDWDIPAQQFLDPLREYSLLKKVSRQTGLGCVQMRCISLLEND
jgi:hypothetical protein